MKCAKAHSAKAHSAKDSVKGISAFYAVFLYSYKQNTTFVKL